MPTRHYSDEDYEELEDLDREISYLRSQLRDPITLQDVRASDFDESVDYELPLLGGNYYVNAIKSGASYKVTVSDEDGNFVNEEGTVLEDPYVDAVVQVSDLDRLRKEMVVAGRNFTSAYIGSKIYELEERRTQIESQYEDEDPMTIAHRRREEEMIGESIQVNAQDEYEQKVIDRLNNDHFMASGWTTRKDDIIEELLELGFGVSSIDSDTIEFTNPDEEDELDEDRYYILKLDYVGSNTITFEYVGYESI